MGAKYHGQIRHEDFAMWPPIPATVEIGAVWGVEKKARTSNRLLEKSKILLVLLIQGTRLSRTAWTTAGKKN